MNDEQRLLVTKALALIDEMDSCTGISKALHLVGCMTKTHCFLGMCPKEEFDVRYKQIKAELKAKNWNYLDLLTEFYAERRQRSEGEK